MNEYGPVPRQQERLENLKTIDAVERMVIGSCIVDPSLLDRCASLRAEDFSVPLRGYVLGVLRDMPRQLVDSWPVTVELDKGRTPPPAGLYGWAPVVSRFLDEIALDEVHFDFYVRAIASGAAARRMRERLGAA
jgi:hypothetical protein